MRILLHKFKTLNNVLTLKNIQTPFPHKKPTDGRFKDSLISFLNVKKRSEMDFKNPSVIVPSTG